MSPGARLSGVIDPVRLRRALAMRGITVAAAPVEAGAGRADAAEVRPAELIEGERLEWRPVGPPEPWPGPVGFLDGVQHVEVVGYAGAAPLFAATLAAAVRERRERRLATVVVERRSLVLGRPAALAAAGDALDDVATLALPEEGAGHPARDADQAARALDRARGELEVAVGARYRARSDAWLVVDGSLTESPAFAGDPRMVGVVKSHGTLPFAGEALERYLRLPSGHRSSLFRPETRRVAPVHAWALRLRPWEGKDLFYGLVRVEVAPVTGTPEAADRISRWLLAERAPLSTPDPRWDRLLYGVHAVERYLRVRSVSGER